MRQKYWDERDRDEKLEALREMTMHLSSVVQSLQDDVQRLLRHQHSASGQMMAPLDGYEAVYHRRRDIPTSLVDRAVETNDKRLGAIHGR